MDGNDRYKWTMDAGTEMLMMVGVFVHRSVNGRWTTLVQFSWFKHFLFLEGAVADDCGKKTAEEVYVVGQVTSLCDSDGTRATSKESWVSGQCPTDCESVRLQRGQERRERETMHCSHRVAGILVHGPPPQQLEDHQEARRDR